MKKTILAVVMGLVALPVSAHVVVKPNTVGIGAFQTFNVGVPVEKDLPAVGLRLVIPDGLEYVSPNVKPGWTIAIKKASDATDAKVTEITWTGGSIPAGQRDDFLFSAKVPSAPTTLQWKAYQTYQDGSVVSWDISPDAQPKKADGSPDFSKSGPYSQTKIVDDLAEPKTNPAGSTPIALSIVAMVFSIIALAKSRKQKTT